MLKKLTARGGPLGIFVEYPALLTLGLICLCAETAWATLLFVMEFYFKEDILKGQSPQFITSKVAWALLAFVGFETLFKYPMGALADKYGPRRFVFLALSICSVTPILLFLFARQWWHFIPLRGADGIAAAALWPAMSALMARAVPREAKAAAMSVFNAAYCLGLAVGPMTGLLIGHLLKSNIYVFPLCAALMMLGLFTAWRTLDSSFSRPATIDEIHSHQGDKQLMRTPAMLKMMVLYGLSQVGVGILAPTVPVYMETQFGILQKDLPRLILVPAVFIVLIALPLGRMPDTLGRAKSVWISYGMAAAGMIMIALTSQFEPTKELFTGQVFLFAGGILLMAASYILGTPAWLGLTSLQVSDNKQAQAMSLMQTAQGIGVVVALTVVGAASHFMTSWEKAVELMKRHRHGRAGEGVMHIVEKSHDSVPLSVWFWIATGVFVLCLIGTLCWVREPEHDAHAEAMAKSSEQPLEISGV